MQTFSQKGLHKTIRLGDFNFKMQSTTTDGEDYVASLSWVEYYNPDEDNEGQRTIRVNGMPYYAIKLEPGRYYNQKVLEGLLLGYCNRKNIDYVTTQNVANCVKEIIHQVNVKQKRSDSDYSDNDIEDDEDKTRTARANKALELAFAHSKELFVNEFGRPFAAMRMSDGHVEVHPMDESRFKNWISGIFYNTQDELLNDDDLKKIVRILTARAEFDDNIPRRSLDIRVRGYNEAEYNKNNNDCDNSSVGSGGSFGELVEDFDAIYYDLTNKKWEAIKITPEGWEIDKHPPFLFRRFGGEAPQVYPDRNYEPDVLDKWVDSLNLKPEYAETQKIIVKVKQTINYWPNTTAKPILILQSSQGTGKTTAFELMRDLVDPNSALTMSMPKDDSQLKQALAHNYMSFFDNLSDITDGQSDILCRGVTGAGDIKRKLYENDEDIVYGYRRIEGVNGITNIVTKSDLLDRGLAVDFAEIPKHKRELLRIIRKKHYDLKPKVLAFCLDVISEVLAERKKWKGIDEYYFA